MNYAEAHGSSLHHSQRHHQQRRRPQHHHQQHHSATTTATTATTPRQTPGGATARQTPSSAQQYRGSVASVSRQERFRRQQAEYFPGIGLDYVNDNDHQIIEKEETNLRTPSPLVLDPSQPTPPSAALAQQQQQSSKQGVVSRFVRGMGVSRDTGATSSSMSQQQPLQQHYGSSGHYDDALSSPSRQHHSSTRQSPYQYSSSTQNRPQYNHQQKYQYPPPPTATDFARRAPRAGFLQKLGTNIPEFKRRFFVLQPTTQLYYFLSPNDTTPRGAIPIDDAQIDMMEELQDGRCRIQLSWPPLLKEEVNNTDDEDNNDHHHQQQQQKHSIILEARNKQVAQEWVSSLQQERMSYVKKELDRTQQQYAQAQYEIKDLKQQIDNYRFVEQDRDGALEDARRWKEQFEQLDEAMRLLANHVRKMPTTTTTTNSSNTDINTSQEQQGNVDAAGEENGQEEKNGEVEHSGTTENKKKEDETGVATEVNEDKPIANPSNEEYAEQDGKGETVNFLMKQEEKKDEDDENNVSSSPRDVSLLDDDAAAEAAASELFESKNIMEELDAPGQHFPSLVNACQQLRENLRLASEEASTAVEDTRSAQTLAKTLQSRMTKAEQQLCQLWEENCSIRKTLKQKKREKRVLVREVRSLLEQQQQQQALVQQQRSKGKGRSPTANYEDDASTVIGSDEEKLINELEEHVVSSIRLHEEFLGAATGDAKNIKHDAAIKGKLPIPSGVVEVKGVPSSSSTAVTVASSTNSGFGNPASQQHSSNDSANTTMIIQNKHHDAVHKQGPPLASLFDSNSSESDSEAEEQEPSGKTGSKRDEARTGAATPKSSEQDVDARSISSVAASFGDDSNGTPGRSRNSTPLRPNPLLQLDQDDAEEQYRLNEGALATQTFKPISLAQRGSATSRLVCPLADVVGTKPNSSTRSGHDARATLSAQHEDLQIYHLTFYTRKIGLQFQKVPPPPTKSKGLLTDAMTADLTGAPQGSCKTTAELKRVAEISTFAKPASKCDDADLYLQVATPIDAVLVCGFEGFDDSGNNIRPKLGARLVAFDGVSVEKGKWTFDIIRKAIQARGRPLTLSFRNDFLTTEQRAIMTKAVGEMQESQPKETPVQLSRQQGDVLQTDQQHHDETRPMSAVPSLQSAISHETDHFVNEKTANTVVGMSKHDQQHQMDDIDDDLTVSSTGYSDHHYNHYYHHQQPQRRRFTASSAGSYSQGSHSYSNNSRRPSSHNFRSFSEAGSSASALSSAVGPLLSNLMSGLSAEKQRANFTPDYLHSRQSVEDIPQHQDFKSNLL